ncbi:TrmH family RNA methyltransferase [Zeaxanthinibacter enoshimensis]|uniref:tRNA (guanosine(18)-2'-O)-methyltransferase n=1 Tax=Zeaxanthinibacter enoshimensis TaxID=392009 RepID=A0A4R6TGT9_9FLAO|nr:RNA methyltransferase [Zeaxanthinibacter enoshimensis]TDQ29467.1 tRNA (guanosine-2'-O-)-methyltransferase [Zeaxanthinibacter enoshimensis]
MVDMELLTYLEDFLSPERRARFEEILEKRTRFITVATEDVWQMHNASAVIRSCEAFGVQQAHLIEGKFGDKLDRKIARGAQKWVDVYRHEDSTSCMQHLRSSGYRIVATSPHATSSSLADFQLDRPTAFFFGTEKEGLSQEVMQNADAYLAIPMAGFTESLNISVSAAIILHELTNRLRSSDLPWQLSDAEKLEKRMDWTRKSIKSLEAIEARFQRERDSKSDK